MITLITKKIMITKRKTKSRMISKTTLKIAESTMNSPIITKITGRTQSQTTIN